MDVSKNSGAQYLTGACKKNATRATVRRSDSQYKLMASPPSSGGQQWRVLSGVSHPLMVRQRRSPVSKWPAFVKKPSPANTVMKYANSNTRRAPAPSCDCRNNLCSSLQHCCLVSTERRRTHLGKKAQLGKNAHAHLVVPPRFPRTQQCNGTVAKNVLAIGKCAATMWATCRVDKPVEGEGQG